MASVIFKPNSRNPSETVMVDGGLNKDLVYTAAAKTITVFISVRFFEVSRNLLQNI